MAIGRSFGRGGGSRGGRARHTGSLGSSSLSNAATAILITNSLRPNYHHHHHYQNNTDRGIESSANVACFDYNNNTIREGEKFATTNDPCLQCTCVAGAPNLCISELCLPPRCDNVKQVEGKCCEFECSTGNVLVSGLNNFESLDYSEQSASSIRHVVSMISCFVVFGVLLYLVQMFRKQKIKSMINNLQAQQARGSQLIDTDHHCAHLMSHGRSQNFLPPLQNLNSLNTQGNEQCQFQAIGDQHTGEIPRPPPSYFGDRMDGNHNLGWKLNRIGDGPLLVVYAPTGEYEEPPASSYDPPPSYDQVVRDQQPPQQPPQHVQPLSQLSQQQIQQHSQQSQSKQSQQPLPRQPQSPPESQQPELSPKSQQPPES